MSRRERLINTFNIYRLKKYNISKVTRERRTFRVSRKWGFSRIEGKYDTFRFNAFIFLVEENEQFQDMEMLMEELLRRRQIILGRLPTWRRSHAL